MLYPILSVYSISTYISPLTYTVSYIFIQYSIFFPNLYPITSPDSPDRAGTWTELGKNTLPVYNNRGSFVEKQYIAIHIYGIWNIPC